MKTERNRVILGERDLQEIFGLFTSSTLYEKEQIYRKDSAHFFPNEVLSEEYSLTEEKRELALDAWRAALTFLQRKGFVLSIDNQTVDLQATAEELFVDDA